MHQKLTILAALGALASLATAPLLAAPASIVLDLSSASRLILEEVALACRDGDGGGPKLDQILIDDVENGGGAGKVHRWVVEAEAVGLEGYVLRTVEFCAQATSFTVDDCDGWEIFVSHVASPQPSGEIVLESPDTTRPGGIFRGELHLPLLVELRNPTTGEVRSAQHDVVYYLRGPWATEPGDGGFESLVPFGVDTDCDGIDDAMAPPTLSVHGIGWVEDPTTETLPGTVCAAGEEGGGWLCASPALDEGTGYGGEPGVF